MIEYKLIRELDRNPYHTQRTLASTLDISLGKANYVLAGLIEKGIIKARKLRNHPDNIRWKYILTPKGIREKIRITQNYLHARLEEFNRIGLEIEELEHEVGPSSSRSKEP
jgi:MarR family transcriptional regulator, temperature-dependent positive regulator of motility